MNNIEYAYRGHGLWEAFFQSKHIASIVVDNGVYLPKVRINGKEKEGRGLASFEAAKFWVRSVADKLVGSK